MTNNHFEPGAYRNTTVPQTRAFRRASRNATTGKEYGDIGYQTNSPNIQLFSRALEGLNPSTQEYKDLTPLECTKTYNTDFVSNRGNVFLITKDTPNTTHNNTILAMGISDPTQFIPSNWMCTSDVNPGYMDWCDPSAPTTNLTNGLPWIVKLKTGEELEIAECKSEIIEEKCKVQFSLEIMIAVIGCNLFKACCMVMAVVRSREPTLVTLGDAVESFLRAPDPTTMGMCFANQRFIKKEWMNGWRIGARQWKQKGVQRWWASVSKTRRITCNSFCLITIIATGVLFGLSVENDAKYWVTDIKSM